MGLRSGRRPGSRSPVDRLRARLTRSLQVRAEPTELVRGDEVGAVVTIVDARSLEQVEVGLVCTEAYAVTVEDDDGESRGRAWATAHETWVAVAPEAGEHTVRLRVPVDGPFSYAGEYLSFTWEVVARAPRRRRLDARAACELWVRP